MVQAYSRATRLIREPRPVGGGVCEVDLSQGKIALIDEADAAMVAACSWCVSYNGRNPLPYAKGRPVRGGAFVRMHRYLLGFPSGLVDHRNKNTLDNRRENLRVASDSQSMGNVGLRSDSTTGLKGVSIFEGRPTATFRGKRIGSFDCMIDAAKAYDAAAIEYFGEFASTNASLGLLPQ